MGSRRPEPGDLVHVVADNSCGGVGLVLERFEVRGHRACRVLVDGRPLHFSVLELEPVEDL